MAFSSEVRFKIGADKTSFDQTMADIPATARKAGDQAKRAFSFGDYFANVGKTFSASLNSVFQRKFSFKDAFKGIMQGIGIGSVESISQLVIRPFELAAERAKEALNLSQRVRAATTEDIGSAGGQVAKWRELRREVNDLNTDIATQTKLVADLNGNPLNFINPVAFEKLRDAERELGEMKARQAELSTRLSIEQRTQNRLVDEFNEKQYSLNDELHSQLREEGERAKLQIRLNHLKSEEARIIEQGDRDTPRHATNVGQQMDILRTQQLLAKAAGEERTRTVTQMGGTLAGQSPDRVPKLRPRGRSELERLADRGTSRLEQADEAIRTGKTPAFVARLTRLGREDLETAGTRARRGSEAVRPEDSKVVGTELVKANETLRSIEKNLAPVKLK